MLHLALFYEPIDLWLAFYITMDDVTVRHPIEGHRVDKHCLYDAKIPTKI
jgi:hypothetical protein